MTEEWRDIPGYEGLYQASDQGQIRSLRRPSARERILKPRIRKSKGPGVKPYYHVNLSREGIAKNRYVHRLIASAFLGFSDADQEVDHINGNYLDNALSNLRLCTRSQNKYNVGKQANSSSPYKGICFNRDCNKWQASIQTNRKHIHLGLFDTPEEAHAAYCEAAKKYAGEFARAK